MDKKLEKRISRLEKLVTRNESDLFMTNDELKSLIDNKLQPYITMLDYHVDEAQELLDSLSTQSFANEDIMSKLFKEAEILCSFADGFRDKVNQVSKELI